MSTMWTTEDIEAQEQGLPDGEFRYCRICGERTHESELTEVEGEGKCCKACVATEVAQ